MKGKKADMSETDCGIARTLQVVGEWWTLLIIRNAFRGQRRFGEFQKSLGLAKNILSVRLKKLVDEGILRIEPDSESALSHLYILTPKGEQLGVVLVALWQWGEENCFEPREVGYVMVDTVNEQPLARLRLTTQSGKILGPSDFRLKQKKTS
ncbi:transcriptional regulator [Herbaspirillum lusitanum]|uniref:winged helix-turn-helix transcriptional regulator n=1 Tax=Herbaspirillum lusitanum TaxID=213312 RepID=UPI0022371F42|nr:helix-turn-helix domain-containing protein [Herbaspirillum lusitanum]MCW5297788.1 transcriptional regulator [Herbaspirillum lusitanum]